MKRILFILFLLLLFIPLTASASNDLVDLTKTILMILSPVIVGAFTALTAKLFKFLGINVDNTIIERCFAEIIQFILEMESKTTLTSQEKFSKVVDKTYSMLSKKEQAVLVKRYGSIENAVEVCFQGTAVALKKSKTNFAYKKTNPPPVV
jgi:hypothetical protein